MKRGVLLAALGGLLLITTVLSPAWAEETAQQDMYEEKQEISISEVDIQQQQDTGERETGITAIGDMYAVDHMYGLSQINGSIGDVSLMAIPSSYTTVSIPSTQTVTISSSGTSKWFRFTAPESKRYSIKAVSNNLDTHGFLYNSAGTLLSSSNDGRVMHNQKDTNISEILTAGNVYYVEVQLKSSTPTGTFSMYFYEDDCPDGTYNAVELEEVGVSTKEGVINYSNDRDMYAFTPPVSGNYTICAQGDVSLVASLYNSSNRTLMTKGSASTASNFTYNLTAGTVYNIEVRGNSYTATGDYRLNVIYKGNVSSVSASSTSSVSISQAGGAKVLSFTPSTSGRYTMLARSNNLKTGALLFDSSGRWLASSFQGRVLYANGYDFNLCEVLTAGKTYYIGTRMLELDSTGNFSVDVYQDDCTGGAYYPNPLSIGTTLNGVINYSYDSDMYQVQPEFSGTYTFTPGQNMIGTLYNSSRTQLATTGTSSTSFQYTLTAGQSYLFEIRHRQSSGTGNYQAKVSLQSITGSVSLSEKTTKFVSLSGAGKSAYYKITPSQSKKYSIYLDGIHQGALYSSEGAIITEFNQMLSSSMASVTTQLTGGQSYYIKAGPVAASSTVSARYFGDDIGGTPEEAESLTINQIVQKQIDDVQDTDVYSFVPSSSGVYLFGTDQSQGVTGKLYNQSKTVVASDTNGGECVISASLTSGQTYYLELESHQQATGSYQLGVSQSAVSVNNAVNLTDESASVSITSGGSKKVFRFVPETSGVYTVKGISSSDTQGGVYNFLGGVVDTNDDGSISGNADDFCMMVSLTAGNTYYLSAGYASSTATGSFTMAVYQDDYFDGRSSSCTALTGSLNGVINHTNDKDVVKFTASENGIHQFQINGALGTLYQSDGTMLAESSGGTIAASLQNGTTYYLEMKAGSQGNTGAYTVTVQTDVGATFIPTVMNEIVDFECGVSLENALTTTYSISFKSSEFEIYDLCGFTYERETQAGVTAGGVTIQSVVEGTDGTTNVTFQTTGISGMFVTKTANIVRLKAKQTGTFMVQCTVQR